MPPKKKGGAKDKKAGGDTGEELTVEQRISKYERRIEALERMLMLRTEQTQRSRAEQEELTSRVRELHSDFGKEQEQRYVIAADMTRQYKAMQEELIGRINILENTIVDLRDGLDLSRVALEHQRKEKDGLIALKDEEISKQKQRMEDMAIEFGEMLKETLEKMSSRIDTSGGQFPVEEAQSLMKEKLESLRQATVPVDSVQ